MAYQAIDELHGKLQDFSGKHLQEERDAVCNAIDALMVAAKCPEP